jgi:methyltransferase
MTLAIPLLATVLLTIVIALRLGELVISRRRVRADAAAGRAEYIREPTYPVMVAVHVGWIAGCALEPLVTQAVFHPWIALPAFAVWVAAMALRFWLMAALGRLWNVRLVQRADQPVVTVGPYRYLRHPNYLAVVLELAAVPLVLGAYVTAIVATLANAWVLWRRISREEAYLFTVPAYRAAFADKKRLIPGVF